MSTTKKPKYKLPAGSAEAVNIVQTAMRNAAAEVIPKACATLPEITTLELIAVLQAAGLEEYIAYGIVDGICDAIYTGKIPIGQLFAATSPAKPKGKPAAKKSPKAAPAKSKAKSKPKAPTPKPATSKPKSPRKSTADRILDVLEAERPAAVGKPTLRKALASVSGGGLDKAIAKLLADGRIVGSDPYSLAGVVDDSKGPQFGSEAAE